MKKELLIFLCFMVSTLSAQIIVLDPGHGYCADCTQNCTSNVRSDVEILTAMAVANKLKVLLQSCSNVTSHLTRTTSDCGDFPSLSQRAAMSNSWGADRFLSIHCNAGGGTGTETFWCDNSASSNVDCQSFAVEVNTQMVNYGNWYNRRVVEDDTYLNFHLGVLSPTNAVGCLSEIGFVDYNADLVKLQSNTWRDSFALAYYVALQNDLNITCSNPTVEVLDCSAAIDLTCGVSYSALASTDTSAVGTYGCNTWTESGPERVHTITPQFNGVLEVEISNYTGDLDAYILENCDPSSCVGTVYSSSAVFENAVAGHTYYIVVDADDGSGSAYDIMVTCPNTLNCDAAIPITCGVTYSGTSSTDSSLVYQYGCNTWTETGPERVHTIVPQNSGVLTATLSNYTGDLDVYILNSCDALDCVGTVSSSSATYNNAVAGHTYYIVVDADDGSNSAYDLLVDCPESLADISLTNASLSSSVIAQGDSVTLNVSQEYNGNTSSGDLDDVELSCYLSLDCNLDNNDLFLANVFSNLGSDNSSEVESINVYIADTIAAGNYYILFVADANNLVQESNENNNILCESLTINGVGDLSIINAAVSPATVEPGGDLNISVEHVYNGTETSSVLDDVELLYYLSPDCIIDTSDVLLASSLSNIGSDNISETLSVQVEIPTNTIEGDYYILFVTDANNDIQESNENNNIVCEEVSVNSFVAIEDVIISSKNKVYPNPTNGKLSLDISSDFEDALIEVYNINGQVVYTRNFTKTIDISDLNTGVYFLLITKNNGEKISFEVVKK